MPTVPMPPPQLIIKTSLNFPPITVKKPLNFARLHADLLKFRLLTGCFMM